MHSRLGPSGLGRAPSWSRGISLVVAELSRRGVYLVTRRIECQKWQICNACDLYGSLEWDDLPGNRRKDGRGQEEERGRTRSQRTRGVAAGSGLGALAD